MKLPKGWKRYNPNQLANEYAKWLYQKEIREDLYINIYEYAKFIERPKCWELDIQIAEDLSVIGKVINIKSFSYLELDFKKIEEDAIKIIKGLTKQVDTKCKHEKLLYNKNKATCENCKTVFDIKVSKELEETLKNFNY